jgi:hypothetical protein
LTSVSQETLTASAQQNLTNKLLFQNIAEVIV